MFASQTGKAASHTVGALKMQHDGIDACPLPALVTVGKHLPHLYLN